MSDPTFAVHNFPVSVVRGAWGVRQIVDHLVERGWHIEDVQDDAFWRLLDVDLLAQAPGSGRVVTLEVKSDSHLRNVYVEEYARLFNAPDADGNIGLPGCMLYTQADFIVYYFVQLGMAMFIPTGVFQNWIRNNIQRFPVKHPANRSGKRIVFSQGRPVPFRILLNEVPGIVQVHGLPTRNTAGES